MIIGIAYDLRSDYLAEGYSEEDVAEFDSDQTIDAIERAIQENGFQTERIGNTFALCSKLAAGKKWDLVFNFTEGLRGRCRESQAPALLELYNIVYTFSDPLVCALTLDKSLAKKIIKASGLATPDFAVVEKESDIGKVKLPFPLFAKPLAEGTGKGIDENSVIKQKGQLKKVCEDLLKRLSQPVLVEEFLPGREFTVGVLGNGDDAYVLGAMEVTMAEPSMPLVYSFVVKEECEKLIKYLPLQKGKLFSQVADLALQSYKVLQCRDAARVDIRCDDKGLPHFLEVNPLPGLHPTHSDLPMIATQEGMSYNDLIGSIINNALKRLKK